MPHGSWRGEGDPRRAGRVCWARRERAIIERRPWPNKRCRNGRCVRRPNASSKKRWSGKPYPSRRSTAASRKNAENVVRQIASRFRKAKRGWNTSARNAGKYKRRCEKAAPTIGASELTPDFLAGLAAAATARLVWRSCARAMQCWQARTIAACLDRARRRRGWGLRIP
jgi:hypothetical protein